MAISKVGTNSSGNLGSAPATLNVTKPTGVTLDSTHRLILVIGLGNSANPGSYTAPSGWTSVGSLLDQSTGSDHISCQVFHAAGDVAALGFTTTFTSDTCGWVMVAFAGCDTSTPIDATGTPNSAVGVATLTTNAVTVATDQSWHCIGFADWLGGTFSATGFTNAENAASSESAALLY